MSTCSPLIASGSGSDLGIQEEVCFGQLPVTPDLRVFPRVSTSMNLTKDAFQSEQVRSDRMVTDSRHGNRSVDGDIVTEIQPGSHAAAYQALLGGVWRAPAALTITGTNTLTMTVNLTTSVVTLTVIGNSFITAGMTFGSIIRIVGGGVPAVEGVPMTIIGIASGTVATVMMPANFNLATIPGPAIVAGTLGMQGSQVLLGNIYRSFTFERAFSDIGSFITYSGVRFNSAAIDLPPTGIATASFGVMGQNARPVATASYDGVAEIVYTQATATNLTFNAANRTITAGAGSFLAAGFAVGDRVVITGTGITTEQNRNPRTITALTATVMTVAEAIQSGGPFTGPFAITRVGLPAYTAVSATEVLVGVSGQLLINGVPAATVTAASINIDNAMAGSTVVGRNVTPQLLWGNQAAITGSLTVLFDRFGPGQDLYNAFDLETEISVVLRLDNSARTQFMAFVMPRVKINSGSIGDAVAEGLPVTVDYVALRPSAANMPVSSIAIQDSTV